MAEMTSESHLSICELGAATSSHVVARAQAFQRLGHRVTLISPVPGTVEGMEVISCYEPAPANLLIKLWRALRVLKTVAAANADVFHAHYAAEWTSWAAALLNKQPLVVSVMGGDVLFDEQASPGPVSRWLTRLTLRRARLVTVKSNQLADVVAGFGVARERIINVLWGVDQNLFKPDPAGAKRYRETWNADAATRIIFSPRMMQPLYNQHLMIEAMPGVLAAAPDALLVLSTYHHDEGYRSRLEAMVRDLNIEDQVRFVPGLRFEEMPAAYSAADITISLPPSDGFPQSVLEGMACGTPSILGDLARYREILTDDETACFTAFEPGAISESILGLLHDDALCARIQDAGQKLVAEKADLDREAARVEARLLKLVENPA